LQQARYGNLGRGSEPTRAKREGIKIKKLKNG